MQDKNKIYKIKIAISNKSFPDKKTGSESLRSLTTDCHVITANINEFAELIKNGHAWTAPSLKDGKFYRAKEYFQGADIFGIDIDNKPGSKYRSIFETLADPFINKYAWLIYPTYSHTPEQNRYRILFHLPETIKELDKYEAIISAFVKIYDSDPSCKDASRLFFGTDKQEIHLLNNRLDWKILQGFTKTAIKQAPQIVSKARKEVKPRVSTPPKPRPKAKTAINENKIAPYYLKYLDKTADRFIDYSIELVKKAPEGKKHNQVLTASRLMGGFIASGWVKEDQGKEVLTDAISNKPHVKSIPDAIKTIEAGISHGKKKQIDYEYQYYIFPLCLLGWRSGYETIEAIKDYGQGKPDQATLDFVSLFEYHKGKDTKVSIHRDIVEMALNRQLGKISYNTFKVYAAVKSFFNRNNEIFGCSLYPIRREFIKRRAAGFRCRAIFPEGFPTLTDRQLGTAFDKLQELNLLWSVVLDKRNKYFGLPNKFKDYQEFEDRIVFNASNRAKRKHLKGTKTLMQLLAKALGGQPELRKPDYNRQTAVKYHYRN